MNVSDWHQMSQSHNPFSQQGHLQFKPLSCCLNNADALSEHWPGLTASAPATLPPTPPKVFAKWKHSACLCVCGPCEHGEMNEGKRKSTETSLNIKAEYDRDNKIYQLLKQRESGSQCWWPYFSLNSRPKWSKVIFWGYQDWQSLSSCLLVVCSKNSQTQ